MCRTLGNGRWIHPDEMLDEMGHRQFLDWQRAYRLNPWGEERADMRMARQVWATLQPHVGKKKIRESEFVFDFRPKQALTPEQYKLKALKAYAANGGFHARKNDQ